MNISFKANIGNLLFSHPQKGCAYLNDTKSTEQQLIEYNESYGNEATATDKFSKEKFQIGDNVLITKKDILVYNNNPSYFGQIVALGKNGSYLNNEVIIKDKNGNFQKFKNGNIFTEEHLNKALQNIQRRSKEFAES